MSEYMKRASFIFFLVLLYFGFVAFMLFVHSIFGYEEKPGCIYWKEKNTWYVKEECPDMEKKTRFWQRLLEA